ncbi:hypothetical protein [Billgrantia desiderata]|uniref:hypothetical protein n=1 Tax=Billgrantia desiderata TaxID=52021 RepID=UPI00089E3CBB|nr:hypothetical protein [Halomonas desiderata]SEG29965.1 antitoxin MazE [Halomonas desiderata]
MDATAQALYQQMRLTILLTAQDGIEGSPFTPEYLLAWDEEIYPILNDGPEWHKPHADCFKISKERAEEMFDYLVQHFDSGDELTFYGLEDKLGIKGTAYSTGSWERYEVIKLCRYFYLYGSFNEKFWQTLTRNGECPSEAHSIRVQPEKMHIYFC